MTSMQHLLPLTDTKGKICKIPVYELQQITAEIKKTNTGQIAKLFNISKNDINRTSSKIDVLIGLDW